MTNTTISPPLQVTEQSLFGRPRAQKFRALEKALELSGLGYSVFPIACGPMELPADRGTRQVRAKDPLCKWTVRATGDPHEVRTLFDRARRWVDSGGHDASQIGVAVSCAHSGIIVEDLDGKKGPVEDTIAAINQMTGAQIALVAPNVVSTASGNGFHVLYRAPHGAKVVTGTNVGGIVGRDIRAGWIDSHGVPQSAGYIATVGSRFGNEYARPFLDEECDDDPSTLPLVDDLPLYPAKLVNSGSASKSLGAGKLPLKAKRGFTIGVTPADPERVRSALAALAGTANDYDAWRDVGFSLKNAVAAGELDEDVAIELFDEFSQFDPNTYPGREEVERKWHKDLSGEHERPRTLGSIFHDAKAAGWVDPSRAVAVPAAQSAGNSAAPAAGILNPDDIAWPIINPNTGRPTANAKNVEKALKLLRVTLRENEFDGWCYVEGFGDLTKLDDKFVRAFRIKCEEMGLKLSKDQAFDYTMEAARQNSWHPVRAYLDSLLWDGTPRIARFLENYMGAAGNEYTRFVSALFFVAAVRRVRQPGSKFDNILVLESPEGRNKSTAIRLLASNNWFTDSLELGDDPKKTIEQTAGKWIVEVAELGGMNKRDVEKVKAQASRVSDRGRLAYDRVTTEVPRQFVMVGTTNEGDDGNGYLTSDTGNRRFWPVAIKGADLKAIARDRDQLWAEASAREPKIREVVLPKKLWAVAGVEQEKRRTRSPVEELLEELLDGHTNGFILNGDIYRAIGEDNMTKCSPQTRRIINNTMKRLGWTQAQRRVTAAPKGAPTRLPAAADTDAGRRVRGYSRGAANHIVSLAGVKSSLILTASEPD